MRVQLVTTYDIPKSPFPLTYIEFLYILFITKELNEKINDQIKIYKT